MDRSFGHDDIDVDSSDTEKGEDKKMKTAQLGTRVKSRGMFTFQQYL